MSTTEEEAENSEGQEGIEEELLENYRECGNHGKAIIRLVARLECKAARKERLNLRKETQNPMFYSSRPYWRWY